MSKAVLIVALIFISIVWVGISVYLYQHYKKTKYQENSQMNLSEFDLENIETRETEIVSG
jgi:cbb3-type cytochrome oxidase subunit 3